MPNSRKSRSESLKRSIANSRSIARAEGFQRARERKPVDHGASPVLTSQLSFDSEENFFSPETEPVPTKMSDDIKAMLEGMKAKLDELPTSEQFSAFGQSIVINTTEIAKNTKRMEAQDQRIAKLAESLERVEREQVDARRGLDAKVRSIIGAGVGAGRVVGDDYDRARKSIRFWPIAGKDEEEMMEGAIAFITGALDLHNYREKIGNIVRVKRVPDNEKSLVYDEIIVEFEDRAKRDYVASRGKKLAEYIDKDKKPTCGMRIHIPEKLIPTFNMLKRYTFHLRKSEGENKSHIKFDDYDRSLFVQVRFLNDGANEWHNVYPEEASDELRKADRKRFSTRQRPNNSPGDSPPRKRRPRAMWTGSGRGEESRMEVGDDEEDEDVVFVEKRKEKWEPPPRAKK